MHVKARCSAIAGTYARPRLGRKRLAVRPDDSASTYPGSAHSIALATIGDSRVGRLATRPMPDSQGHRLTDTGWLSGYLVPAPPVGAAKPIHYPGMAL